MRIEVLGGNLEAFGSKWSLELYLKGWWPEAAKLFRASFIHGLTGRETRVYLEGIRPLVEYTIHPAPDREVT